MDCIRADESGHYVLQKRAVSDPDPLGLEAERCPHIRESLTYCFDMVCIDSRENSCDLVEVGIPWLRYRTRNEFLSRLA